MTVRAVLDTNTVISGLLWGGAPHHALLAVESGLVQLRSSPFLLWELSDTLTRKKFDRIINLRGVNRSVLETHYRKLVDDVVEPDFVPVVIPGDPDDDQVLACAVKANADVIVSGDAHLKELKTYSGIPIMNAADFLGYLLASDGDPVVFSRQTRLPATK